MTNKSLIPFNFSRSTILLSIFLFVFLGSIFGILFYFLSPRTSQTKSTAYWIWAGIKPDKTMARSVLYVYQGHMKKQRKNLVYERLGLAPHPLPQDIYIVYRVTGSLPDPKAIESVFRATATHWQRHKVNVLGVQLDFDAPTSKLLVYSSFLQEFRKILPASFKLSITGLSDWIIFGDSKSLSEIAENTDEVVFQLYQNNEHFPEINTYLKNLSHKGIPFKIGLLANQNHESYIAQIKDHPYFKGTVLFVQKNLQTNDLQNIF